MRLRLATLLPVLIPLLPPGALAQGSPRFDYTPPPSAAPASAGVSLAVVAPYWSTNESWTQSGLYADFASALRGDFFELVTSRGFTARGPFPSYQAMLFPDKQSSDLVLVPELDLKVRFENLSKKTEMFSGQIKYRGRAVIGGRVNLSLTESLTNERMWTRSIEVTGMPVRFEMKKWLDANTSVDEASGLIMADPGFRNAIVPVLDSVYLRILQTSWDYLDPGELGNVKRQSEAIRAKKAY